MKRLKIGAVGLGRLGRYHAESVAHRIPGVDLSAVCSIDEKELDEAQSSLGVKNVFNSYELMLEQDLDAVVLSTPSHLHCDQIELALEKGLHVFCEKPLDVDLKRCLELEQRVQAYPNQIVMLGFMRRYDDSYRQAFDYIQQGKIGRPILFRGYSIDPVSQIEGAIKYAPHSAGQFLDMAIHDIDLSRWLLGAEPTAVFASGGCYAYEAFGQFEDGDNVGAMLTFDNQSMAFLLAGRTAPHGYHIETEIIGTQGTLRIGAVPQQTFVEILDQHGVRKVCHKDFIDRFGQAYVNELQAFVDGIRAARPPGVTIKDGVEATRIAIAATQSFKQNTLIRLSS